MNDPTWVFDVDGCLVDALTGSSLRPGAVGVLRQLRAMDRCILLWSAGGVVYAEERARQHRIDDLFAGYHGKDERDADGFYRIDALGPVADPVFVDDHPEDISPVAMRLAVSTYLSPSVHDKEFETLLARAADPSEIRVY